MGRALSFAEAEGRVTDTCSTCQCSRPVPARVNLAPFYPGDEERMSVDRILCNRMPQAVENDADYVCGEFIRKRST